MSHREKQLKKSAVRVVESDLGVIDLPYLLLPLLTVPARVVSKDGLLDAIRDENPELLVTFGAGDIDRFCGRIAETLSVPGRPAAKAD